MKKTDRKNAKKEEVQLTLVDSLSEMVRRELLDFVHGAGMAALAQVLEEDREALCGRAYERGRAEGPRRAGSAVGELTLGGRRVQVRRPRVRDKDGEVALPSWQQFAAEDPLEERALEQMVIGVSTRKYRRSLEDVPVTTRGESRSAVSRRFKAATKKQVDALLSRPLADLDLVSVMMDGIHIAEHVILVALGISASGRKHVLGLWEGATENKAVCTTMLDSLVERGLDPLRSCLFVIDGSKALRAALRAVWGDRALVQRCQVHKVRNVVGHLPKHMHASARATLREAYSLANPSTAKKKILTFATVIEEEHPSAAESLREGLDETLTVQSLGLSGSLARSLRTTNAIENLNGGVRDVSRRVKRWRGGGMIRRWVAAAVLEREASFRKLKGYRGLPKLVKQLRANDEKLAPQLDREALAS